MRHNYPYLKDSAFLLKIDKQKIKEQYIKIICLDINERPLKEVQGRCTGGSLNLSGSSAVRRTCNLSMIADEKENDLTDLDNLFSTNKRVEVEIGFLNTTEYYTQFDIIWFPLGIYVIKTPSITHNTTSVDISLTLEDKMCLLNGTMGGKFPASVEFSRMEDEFGNLSYPTMYQIILELVHHFGGEQLSKIIINDLDEYVKVPKRWMPKDGLLSDGKQIEDICIEFSENIPVDEDNNPRPLRYEFISADAGDEAVPSNFHRYKKGDWIGFTYEPFTYPGCETGDENKQLVGNAGESVCTILDKIKNVLGNFEYFYDINGNFIFQEIKNYLNTSQATTIDKDGHITSGYDIDISRGKSVYSFTDNMLVTNLSNNPQYEMIKNDYVVWGIRDGADGEKIPIRYHLAIDEKPQVGNWWAVFPYYDIEEMNYMTIAPDGTPMPEESWENNPRRTLSTDIKIYPLYQFDDFNNFSSTDKNNILKNNITLNQAIANNQIYPAKQWLELKDLIPTKDLKNLWFTKPVITRIKTQDWRTELFLQGKLSEIDGTYSNYYYAELKNEWDKLFHWVEYEDENGKYYTDEFRPEVLEDPSQIDFFLDFINTDSKMGELNVTNIGRRSEVMNGENQGVNCMFEPNLPDIIFIQKDGDNHGYPYIEDTIIQKAAAAIESNWNFSSEIDTNTSYSFSEGSEAITLIDNLATVFNLNSAFFNIRDLLYQYTSYNEAISLQTIPVYYLEPNTRITVKDMESGINGDYMINTISIPFDIGSTMSVTAQKVLEKI